MRYPAWLGTVGAKDEKLRSLHGLLPTKDGWYKTVSGKKRYIAKPMPLADVVGLLDARIAEIRGQIPEQHAKLSAARTTLEGLAEMFMAHLWHRHQTGQPRKLSRRTYDDYYDTIKRFVEVVGPGVIAINPSTTWFSKFARSIAKKAVSSRRREMIYVTAFFNWAGPGRHALGFYKEPVKFGPDFVKPDAATLQQAMDATSTAYTPDQLNAALKAVRDCPVLLAAGLIGINCAYLPSDIRLVPEKGLDLAAGTLGFPRNKTTVARKAALKPETIAAIRAYLAVRPKPAEGTTTLFVRDDGRPFNEDKKHGPERKGSRGNSVAAYWRQVVGLPFKGLRTTFGTVADGFQDDGAVDVVMGHGPKTVRRKHYVKGFERERLQRLADHVWARCRIEICPPGEGPIEASELVRRALRRRTTAAKP